MSQASLAFLPLLNRGVVTVTGPDAVPFLDNLVTNSLDKLQAGEARFGALLSPQGKIQYEFLALRRLDGFLLDTHRATAAEFVKRLTVYKLRAQVTIKDESAGLLVAASRLPSPEKAWLAFVEPRDPALGYRIISRDTSLALLRDEANEAAYRRLRIMRAVPQAGVDYMLGETFPHEANYDRLGGVSFTKGCYVGQEVVARMQNKTVVRRRVVKIVGREALTGGAVVLAGTAEIGRVGTTDGRDGLAMLRLDRVVEALTKGQSISAADVAITVDASALAAYNRSVAERPAIDL